METPRKALNLDEPNECFLFAYFYITCLCYINVMKQDKLELLKEAKAKEQEYKDMRKAKLDQAKAEPSKWKRFWKIVWHLTTFPFSWLWHNLKDWHTMVIFVAVFLIVSCEVWVPYLIAVIVGIDTTLGQSMLGVGTACWTFWLLPATPFLPLCITITIGIKALFNKIRFKKLDK